MSPFPTFPGIVVIGFLCTLILLEKLLVGNNFSSFGIIYLDKDIYLDKEMSNRFLSRFIV